MENEIKLEKRKCYGSKKTFHPSSGICKCCPFYADCGEEVIKKYGDREDPRILKYKRNR